MGLLICVQATGPEGARGRSKACRSSAGERGHCAINLADFEGLYKKTWLAMGGLDVDKTSLLNDINCKISLNDVSGG